MFGGHDCTHYSGNSISRQIPRGQALEWVAGEKRCAQARRVVRRTCSRNFPGREAPGCSCEMRSRERSDFTLKCPELVFQIHVLGSLQQTCSRAENIFPMSRPLNNAVSVARTPWQRALGQLAMI